MSQENKTVIPATVHICGPYKDWVQVCTRCGEVLTDYRNAAWPVDQEPPRGFEEGIELVVTNSNPSYFEPRDSYNGPMKVCEP